MINKFIKTNDVGYLLGEISDNVIHQHYAVQIIVSITDTFVIQSHNDSYQSQSLLIKSMQAHQLHCNNQQILIMLINPASKLGHLLNKHNCDKTIQDINNEWITGIREFATKWYQGTLSDIDFIEDMKQSTQGFIKGNKKCFHKTDKRILSALEILEKNSCNVLPLETIASQVFLSPSRFIHLFKKETGITYRRMQLWNKLMASIDDIARHKSITDLAHAHGFSDSAHYSRTFKQTFGINPKLIFKNSQFVQF